MKITRKKVIIKTDHQRHNPSIEVCQNIASVLLEVFTAVFETKIKQLRHILSICSENGGFTILETKQDNFIKIVDASEKKTHKSMVFVAIVHVICLHTSAAAKLVKKKPRGIIFLAL